MSFDAGALLFKIQTAGIQQFRQDQASAERAIEKTGQSAQGASEKVEKLGKATDDAGKKAKESKAPLDQQSKATEDVGKKSETAAQKLARLKREQQEAAAAAKELSTGLVIAGTAAAALVTLSVAKYAEFGAQMSNVRAATMANVDEQKALGDAALDAGADTAYSATEAAAAEEELAKAGQSVADVVGGSLNASLALAAAGQLQVARSAEIMATAMTQFEIPAENAAHVSDVLAAGAGKAQGSVDDLALALSYVGPLANQAGWSIDETSGSLAYFASQGILGEKAGTSLRGVLAALQAPSTVAAKTMEQYGLSIYDANGNMLSASQIAGQLQKSFGHLSQEERNAAMGRIFGNESLVAANLLYAGGAEKISEWTDAVTDTGYAARQAAMRQDNLAGDVEKLGGAFDTALIKSGSAANDVLRGMVQSVTFLVDMFGEAPDPVQQTALVLGVAAAAMLLFSGGAVKARASFLELKTQLDATNTSMKSTALIGGIVGLALTGVITVVGLLMAKQAEARRVAESYADTIEDGAQRIGEAARDIAIDELQKGGDLLSFNWQSAYDAAEKLGVGIDTVTDAALGNQDAIASLKPYYDALEQGGDALNKIMDETGLSAYEARFALEAMVGGIQRQNTAIEEGVKLKGQEDKANANATEGAQSATDAYLAQAESVEDLSSQLSQLVDQINEANGVNQDAITANADYQQTLADVKSQVDNIKAGLDGYGKGLDLTTQAGRDNMKMLQGLAEGSQSAAEAQLNLDGNTETYIARLREGRDALIESAIQMGATEDEAEALADQIYAIPNMREIDILAQTEDAQVKIERLRDTLKSIPGFRQVTLETITYGNRTVSAQADGSVRYYANGGVEHHVAQIARAGDVRVWAEPETGGESYIPHAPSKRARSEQIMQETARALGGTYIPAGAQGFADGAAVAAASTQATPVVVEVKASGELMRFIEVAVQQPNKQAGFRIGGI